MTKEKKPTKARSKHDIIRKANWSPEQIFQISGREFEALAQIAIAFEPLVSTYKRVLKQSEMEDKLVFDYMYSDGAQVPIHLVNEMETERKNTLDTERKMMEEYLEALKAKGAELNAKIEEIELSEKNQTEPAK